MRIRSVSIAGLFNSFDHRIPVFQREPITIIYGPNGVGKTSILRLIHGALAPRYSWLRQVPFRELAIEFVDGTTLHITQTGTEGKREPRHTGLSFRLITDGRVLQGEFSHFGKVGLGRSLSKLEAFLPFLTRTGPEEWIDPNSGGVLTLEDVLRLYGGHLPEEFRQIDTPAWLEEIQKSTPVHLIETQRLLATAKPMARHHAPGAQEPAVQKCARELAEHINSTLARSATESQGLERSFPARLISEEAGTLLGEGDIRRQLADLDTRRARLEEAGLLELGYEPALPAKRFDETTQRVLAVYIRDTEKKLAVFDELLSRIELIKSIVDSRFLGKSLSIDRVAGFVLKSRDGKPLDLSGLSSGEQHELVLLYELLFRAEQNTLILIDEPELSLHIAWQQQFLRDLLRITKLATLQALVATHSPQIIHDRWDLAVELLGPSR